MTEHNHQANHRPPYRLRIDEVTSRSEALPSRSHSGRRVVIAACLALILVWGLLQVGFRLWRSGYQARATYGATEVAPIIDSLADVIPPATNPDAWRQAVAETHAMLVTLTAANLLDLSQMQALRNDLTARVARARAHPETAPDELARLWNMLTDQAGPILDARHPRPKLLPPGPQTHRGGD